MDQPLILDTGLTRRVVLLGDVAVKQARSEHGRRANLMEARLSPRHPDKLCPVLHVSADGDTLVMRRARALTAAEWARVDPVAFRTIGSGRLPIEKKQCSFGMLDGRLVAVDYGG